MTAGGGRSPLQRYLILLEARARQATPGYRRARVIASINQADPARQAGIWLTTSTVSDWFNRGRVSYEFGPLWSFAEELLRLGGDRAGRVPPARDPWWTRERERCRGLWEAARDSRRAVEVSRRTVGLAERGQVTDRYIRAIEQLGSDQLDVRIGGIYALERIAHDSPWDSPAVVEVLAAFIREHSREPWPSAEPAAQTPKSGPRPDVQAAVTVIGRRNPEHDLLTGLGLSTNVVVDLAGASLSGAILNEARLGNAMLDRADLSGADLNLANLFWARLTGANLAGADLYGAYIGSADLTGANLNGACLRNAELGGSDLTRADLTGANLTDADLNEVNLTDAKLADVDLTRANLRRALWPADVAVPDDWQRRDSDGGRLWALSVSEPVDPEKGNA